MSQLVPDWSSLRRDFPILDQKVHGQPLIYFDNAATTYPKPEEVTQAMVHFSRMIGASPGRSGHRLAVEAGRIVFEA